MKFFFEKHKILNRWVVQWWSVGSQYVLFLAIFLKNVLSEIHIMTISSQNNVNNTSVTANKHLNILFYREKTTLVSNLSQFVTLQNSILTFPCAQVNAVHKTMSITSIQ